MDNVQHKEESSDSSLSPVPSPHTNGRFADTIHVNPYTPQSNIPRPNNEGVVPTTLATSTNAKDTTPASIEKVKKPRKKKDPEATPKAKSDDKLKEKKPRKPRTINPDGQPSRKKQKVGDGPTPASTPSAATPRQPTITEMVGQYHRPPPSSAIRPQQQTASPNAKSDSLAPAPVNTRPASSGQRYDPIRGMNIEDYAPSRTPPMPSSPHLQRAAPSPTVASMMNPIFMQPSPTLAAQASASSPPLSRQLTTASHVTPNATPQPSASETGQTTSQPSTHPVPPMSNPVMDIDKPAERPKPDLAIDKPTDDKTITKTNSSAPTPKTQRPTPPTTRPPLPGSGLLSSSDLFGGPSADGGNKARQGIDINIEITLDRKGGNVVNIAQEIMRKYGKDALNPKAAAHRERLLQVAAAANRLEQGSGDEMSVDLSDADNDSNVEMGGMGDDKSTAGETANGDKVKKRRRRKVEDYDKEDDFIDDTEMAWQEQAAVATDGFFVYSGPLLREEEQIKAERCVSRPHICHLTSSRLNSSATSGRGKGRGRGRGRGGTNGVTHAALAAKSEVANTPEASAAANRGKGKARGTGAPRKPRITKADRERMDTEKTQREQQAVGIANAKAMMTPHPPPSAVATAQ